VGRTVSICGAAIAGGKSVRYGEAKSFATVAGERLIDRVLRALRDASDTQVIIANDVEAYDTLGLPVRSDVLEDAGAVAGIHAALLYAAEQGCEGALVLACDMPFPSAPLLRALVQHGREMNVDAVLPASDSRRGMEPLCAWYSTRCIVPIERAVARDDLRVIAFHDEVRVAIMPPDQVARFGDPERLFMNVNTREDRDHAERLAQAG
jgi:molybdopterin-guanine dinucleotide biosynthesis protein A